MNTKALNKIPVREVIELLRHATADYLDAKKNMDTITIGMKKDKVRILQTFIIEKMADCSLR